MNRFKKISRVIGNLPIESLLPNVGVSSTAGYVPDMDSKLANVY